MTVPALTRRLGLGDAVVLGLGAMIGAGVFAALGPAARAAHSGLLLSLVIAAVVAYCNATSSARLAARYPQSGGTYVYGRERLGPLWGHLAGWSFVVGKTASCAAMALTFAAYAWPEQARPVAAAAVVALTALGISGVQRSARVTRVIVALVLAVLATVVVVGLATSHPHSLRPFPDASPHGVLQAAGLLFFAFAGYARIATLGEEVRDPARTIPRAISIALAITVVTYALVAVAALVSAGAGGLAASAAPLRTAVEAAGAPGLAPVVRIGGALAALGALLALLLGVSRTMLAMARDRHLPATLTVVSPRSGVPHHAELAVGAAVLVLTLTTDLRAAIGFSSFGVLAYYAIANVSAWTLRPDEGRPAPWIPVLGLVGCAALAVSLPLASALAGVGVLVLGVLVFGLTRRGRA